MKRIGSLLTAGALALSLVTLPAGAAEGSFPLLDKLPFPVYKTYIYVFVSQLHSTPCGRMGRSSSPATREIIPARRTAPSPMTFCTALAR